MFDSSCFRGKNHFEDDGSQNHLIFQLIDRYFKRIIGVGSGEYIYFSKSKRLSDERINFDTASNYSIYYSSKIRAKFNGNCLNQEKIPYANKTIVNIYMVYEISKNYNISSYPTLENCLFGAVILTKHNDIDEYKYSEYGTGFDKKGLFQ